MNILKIILQAVGIFLLIPTVALATLRLLSSGADGPSILFPGGELVSGNLHAGPEPDWSFTDQIPTIELQLNDPLSSRRIYVMESEGKLYIVSGYMSTTLGRLWKHWAVQADEGNTEAVMRINGVRYERQVIRINEGPILDGVVAKLTSKYNFPAARASIEAGHTWIFELAPKET